MNSQTFYDVSIYFLSSRNFFDFFFWKSQSNLKKEKQKKMRKEKSKRKTGASIRAGPLRPAIYIAEKGREKKGMHDQGHFVIFI